MAAFLLESVYWDGLSLTCDKTEPGEVRAALTLCEKIGVGLSALLAPRSFPLKSSLR